MLAFTPDQLEKFYKDLNSHHRKLRVFGSTCKWRKGTSSDQLSAILSQKLAKKKKGKTFVVGMLVDVFFVLDNIILLATAKIQGRHCGVKRLSLYLAFSCL